MLEFVQIAIGGLVVGSIYAAIALGFSLVYRVTGAINLSQGGFALHRRDDRLYLRPSPGAGRSSLAILAAVVATVVVGRALGAH